MADFIPGDKDQFTDGSYTPALILGYLQYLEVKGRLVGFDGQPPTISWGEWRYILGALERLAEIKEKGDK